ncbi:serine/threonine-protein phosphatase [Geodermatophilus marinus]|nr:serine/threonine-protein phosphatase [Geodermatophilus sp. LHW52908]
MPLVVLVLFAGADLLAGPDRVLLSLVVITPVVAATSLGRRATLAYAVLALVTAALLGVYDGQYDRRDIDVQVVRLFAVALGGALAVAASTLRLRREEDVARLSAEAARTTAVVQLAEDLQRDLLGPPPQVEPWASAVRYLPASRHAQVGGDWYDAFPDPEGRTVLVIGDVAGHGPSAAATMAQARGMLRAVAQSADGSPASLLSALDRAFAVVGVPTLITCVVATVDLRPHPGDDGPTARLRWSNAGHPPPVLLRADGRAELLERVPDLLLGLAAGAARHDHAQDLCPGDTVLFFTDGLVERRGAPIDAGLAWLTGTLEGRASRSLDELCDGLLEAIGGRVDDDVALLAVRVPDGR